MPYILDHTYHPLSDIPKSDGGFERYAVVKGTEIFLEDEYPDTDGTMTVSSISTNNKKVIFRVKTDDIKKV